MEYIDGEDFDKIDITKYEQYKFVLLLNLFVRNNLINLDFPLYIKAFWEK